MPDKPKCGAKKRNGDPCGRPRGWGTPHPGYGNCKNHGGCTPNGIKSAEKEAAGEAVAIYGLPREVDPHSALIEELHRTAGHVAYLAQLIQDLDGDHGLKQFQTGENGTIERASVWVDLYHEERKHFTNVAKTCIAVGIEERRVRVAEEQGQLMAQVVRGILADLKVDLTPEVQTIVRRNFTVIEGGAA